MKSEKNELKRALLANKYQIRAYIFILSSQIFLNASFLALYYIIKNPTDAWLPIAGFFVFLILSYLASYPMRMDLSRSIMHCRNLILKGMLQEIEGKFAYLNEGDIKSRYIAAMRTNLPSVIGEYCSFYFYLFLNLTAIFSAAAVLVWLHGFIYLGFIGVALLVSLRVIKQMSRQHKSLAREMELQENNLSQIVEGAWGNSILKNLPFFTQYRDQIALSLSNVRNTTLTQEAYYRSRIILLSVGIVLFFGLPIFFLYHFGNMSSAEIIVALPIIRSVIANTVNAARELSFANNLAGRLDAFFSMQVIPELSAILDDIISRINFQKIMVIDQSAPDKYYHKFTTFDEILHFFKEKEFGYFSIRGENGSGKSSLLTALCERLPNVSLIPITISSVQDTMDIKSHLSTGESQQNYIRSVFKEISPGTTVILDEPLANLDKKSRENVHTQLFSASNERLIIETGHENQILN